MTEASYTLTDCLRQHATYPATFGVPDPDEIGRLRSGDLVKLIFELPVRDETGMVAERMWVRISSVLPSGRFTGELDNEPFVLGINPGHWVKFEACHIADIYPADDRHLLAQVADNKRRARERGFPGADVRFCERCGASEEADPTVIRDRESQGVLCDTCALLDAAERGTP